MKGEQLFYFYYVKNEKIELNPNHKFGIENTPADEITQLNPLNGYGSLSEQSQTATTINPITYDSTEYVGLESHGCLGPVAAAAGVIRPTAAAGVARLKDDLAAAATAAGG